MAPPVARVADSDVLGQRRVDAARKRIAILQRLYEKGMISSKDVFDAYRDIALAARDSGLRGEALLHPLTEYRDAIVQLRDLMKSRVATGAENEDATNRAEVQLAEAEYWLAEAKAR